MTLHEKIAEKLSSLQEYVGYLRKCQKYSLDELLQDPIVRGAVERYLQLAAEVVIDIAEIMISELGLRKAEEYKEAILILGEAGILPAHFALQFSPIAGFRNILVHEYTQIDLKLVHQHLLHDLDDFDRFTQHLVNYLKRTSAGG